LLTLAAVFTLAIKTFIEITTERRADRDVSGENR